MQAVQIELFQKSREEQEQETFLNILHHDASKRGGFFARLDLRVVNAEKEIRTKWGSKNAYSIMTTDAAYNRYITLNSFHNMKAEQEIITGDHVKIINKRTLKRDADHLHAISTVYLDLDFHDGTLQEIQERVRNTKELLNKVYKEGTLPRPTMVTETGRGLGIFYVLERTIANTRNAQKQINFWKYICTEFANKYKDLLSESDKPQLGIDYKVVGEVTRVVRLPGTKNLNTNTVCRLISVAKKTDGSPLYYALGDLVQYVENYKVYKEPYKEERKKIARKKIVNLQEYTKPYLAARLNKLERAQDLFRDEREGHRELLCFLYYNTAKQIMDEQEAIDRMLAFHDGFTYPLESQGELDNIIESVRKAKNIRTGEIQGYYEYTDAKIKEELGLTEAQNEYVGFGSSLKSLARRRRKEENQKARKERNKNIATYVIKHPEATYEEIAGLFGVSIRTLKGILKQEGVYRYQKQVSETSICAGEKPVEEVPKDNIISIEEHVKSAYKTGDKSARSSKVQKNALVSKSVVLPHNNSNTISHNTIPMSIKHKGNILYKAGNTVYTDKELRRIRGILDMDDGWVKCDFDWDDLPG